MQDVGEAMHVWMDGVTSPSCLSSSSLFLSSIEFKDSTIYEPEIRALLGTDSHFCEVVVLESRAARVSRCGDCVQHVALHVALHIPPVQKVNSPT